MGADLFQEYDFAREIFDAADDIAKAHISKLCFKGPMEELTQTIMLQPAVTAVNLACLTAIEKEGVFADVSAGHSLGEFSALTSAKSVSLADTLKLVFKRGRLMHGESLKYKGAMHAIVGIDIQAVDNIVAQCRTSGKVSVANHNSGTQIVITGEPDAVKAASAMAKENGAKAIPLKVSGAWHSDLIKGAEQTFIDYLGAIVFKDPESRIVHNVTADISHSGDEIRTLLGRQLCSPVKWYDTILKMMQDRVEIFAEIGPGKVLTGLLKKIVPKDYQCSIYNVGDMKSLEVFLKEIS